MSVRKYEGIDVDKVKIILDTLKNEGCAITGENPWTAEISTFNIVLQGEWDESQQVLAITLKSRPSFVPESVIWGRIAGLIRQLDD
jgi:hypothetical protein